MKGDVTDDYMASVIDEMQQHSITPANYLDYKNKPQELLKQQFVILSYEQAMHLKSVERPWDGLVMDEIRTGVGKFAEESTLTTMECITQVARAYDTATYVVQADADCQIDGAVDAFRVPRSVSHHRAVIQGRQDRVSVHHIRGARRRCRPQDPQLSTQPVRW